MKLRSLFILTCLATNSVLATPEADRLVFEGIDAYKAHDYDSAISKFTEAIRLDSKTVSAYNNRGLTYREKKDYDAAVKDFTQALLIQPDWFVYFNRGIAYYEKGEPDPAIADFTEALKLNKKDPQGRISCLITRARANFEKEKITVAMTDLNAAIKIGVTAPNAYAYRLRGILHKINRDYDRSLADYEKAISLDAKDASTYEVEAYLLAVCPMPKYRDARKTIAYALKACELTEWKDARPIETLAAAYAEGGQFEEAIKFQTRAGEIDPKAIDETRLALYHQKQPFRALGKGDQTTASVANIKDKIVINLGQKLFARFEIREGQPVDPNIAPTKEKKTEPDKFPNSLWLQFGKDERGRILFLWHSFAGTVRARCLARLKGYDTYFEAEDIRPIPVKIVSPTAWKEPVEELVLFDFKLADKKRP